MKALLRKIFGRDGPRIGVFSVISGKSSSLTKVAGGAGNTKCAGECTCKCAG